MRYILLLLLLSTSISFAQNSVSGTVKSNGEPLIFANVFIPDLSVGATTDENGFYRIEGISNGTYNITASYTGFTSETRSLVLVGGPSIIDFQLIAENSLEEVVISGTMRPVSKLKSPVPVEVYSETFFKKNPTPSIFESLQNVNGVRPQLNCNICNTGDIHINGLEGPYTFVLIDGMPIVSGLSTVYGLTGIPQSLIERIEVVKGPASTLYGSEAVGGIINVITKKPGSAPEASVESFVSGWGEINTDLGLRYDLGEKTKGLLGVNYFNYQNPIDNNNDGFTDLTLQNRISIFNKFDFQREEGRVFNLAGRFVYEDRWGGEMDWNSSFRGGDEIYGESIYTARWEAFGTYQLPLEVPINFQFSANGHDQNSFYGTDSYNADQYIGFGQFTWNTRIGRSHDLLIGAAYRYTYYDDNTFATAETDGITNNPSVTHLPGIFVQDEIGFDPNNTLLLGMRWDYNSIHGNIFSPRLNYKWNSDSNNSVLRLSAGNGFRVANVFTEDHAALTGARDVVFEGELDPETSWNVNANFVQRFFWKNGTIFSLDASAFYTYFSNRILPDYETDPNKIIYANLDGSSVSQGVSLNTDMVFRNGLKVLAGATLMDVSVTENGETTRQLLTESFSGVWSVSYKFDSIDLTVDYTGNVYGPMRLPLLSDLDPRDEFSPWFSIQNIQFTKKFGTDWELFGGVKNLLNFTPADDSIARAFDPFDEDVVFDENGQAVPTPDNPYALTFDPSYVYTSNQGIRGFVGLRYTVY